MNCRANQLTGYYMMGTLVVKGLSNQNFWNFANVIVKRVIASEIILNKLEKFDKSDHIMIEKLMFTVWCYSFNQIFQSVDELKLK